MIKHTITQEDLDNNPGLEQELKVGDVVELPSPEKQTPPEGGAGEGEAAGGDAGAGAGEGGEAGQSNA